MLPEQAKPAAPYSCYAWDLPPLSRKKRRMRVNVRQATSCERAYEASTSTGEERMDTLVSASVVLIWSDDNQTFTCHGNSALRQTITWLLFNICCIMSFLYRQNKPIKAIIFMHVQKLLLRYGVQSSAISYEIWSFYFWPGLQKTSTAILKSDHAPMQNNESES